MSNESFNGKTLAHVMKSAGSILNIPTNPAILLNSEEISDRDIPLSSDNELEFVKPAGERGAA